MATHIYINTQQNRVYARLTEPGKFTVQLPTGLIITHATPSQLKARMEERGYRWVSETGTEIGFVRK